MAQAISGLEPLLRPRREACVSVSYRGRRRLILGSRLCRWLLALGYAAIGCAARTQLWTLPLALMLGRVHFGPDACIIRQLFFVVKQNR